MLGSKTNVGSAKNLVGVNGAGAIGAVYEYGANKTQVLLDEMGL